MESAATQEKSAALAAQDLFVTVPETILHGEAGDIVVPEFRVAQYHCAKGADGKAVIDPSLPPWVNVTQIEAIEACKVIGKNLLTESQSLALQLNLSQQDCNWTKGKVGNGKLFQGIRKWNVESAMPGNYEPDDEDERRWMTLSTGERICDANGNVYTRIYDDIQGDENGLVAKAFAANSPSITTAPYPSMEKGVGWYPSAGANWSGLSLIRGGCWGSESYAGVFYLYGDWPVSRSGDVGFRCTEKVSGRR